MGDDENVLICQRRKGERGKAAEAVEGTQSLRLDCPPLIVGRFGQRGLCAEQRAIRINNSTADLLRLY